MDLSELLKGTEIKIKVMPDTTPLARHAKQTSELHMALALAEQDRANKPASEHHMLISQIWEDYAKLQLPEVAREPNPTHCPEHGVELSRVPETDTNGVSYKKRCSMCGKTFDCYH